ncbi:MAG TPA: hypothetical protein V6C81_29520 [Planktothrix sp.]|jgi:hypothetical protein
MLTVCLFAFTIALVFAGMLTSATHDEAEEFGADRLNPYCSAVVLLGVTALAYSARHHQFWLSYGLACAIAFAVGYLLHIFEEIFS